jgi:pyridoxine 5-phosphate synthase
MPVFISVEPDAAAWPVNRSQLKNNAARLLALCGREEAELSILLVSDRRIAELNRTFRHKKGATNVLAFAQAEGPDAGLAGNILGDIVISWETAAREAGREKTTVHQRLLVLLVHGLLHLLGYDHERSAADEGLMFDREKELLSIMQKERRGRMIKLAINVDHVATIREARGINEPDPVLAAGICELAGAEGIVVHLREDRRHIQDRDVLLLRQTVKTKLNLEMGANPEIVKFALDLQPDMVTLVPEKRKELTTEGGLNVTGQKKKIKEVISRMSETGIPVSLFIDPDSRQISAAADVGATFVEIHTGRYADAENEDDMDREFDLIALSAEEAYEAGLRVNAGHGLNYLNTARIAGLEQIEELSIGHAVISRAVFVGMDQAVREMLALLY